jgi:hypothetical protein
MEHALSCCAPQVLAAALLFFALQAGASAQNPPSSASTGSTAAAGGAVPPCDAAQLSFGVDRENGQFDGMSHSGALLVLRNLGPGTCAVPARPELRFLDAQRRPLAVAPREPAGMHPGPVILPVAVPVGAELTSEARWVSGDAYGADNCVSPEFVALSLAGHTMIAPLGTHMCGPAGKAPAYTATLFHRDPPYVAPPR